MTLIGFSSRELYVIGFIIGAVFGFAVGAMVFA